MKARKIDAKFTLRCNVIKNRANNLFVCSFLICSSDYIGWMEDRRQEMRNLPARAIKSFISSIRCVIVLFCTSFECNQCEWRGSKCDEKSAVSYFLIIYDFIITSGLLAIQSMCFFYFFELLLPNPIKMYTNLREFRFGYNFEKFKIEMHANSPRLK